MLQKLSAVCFFFFDFSSSETTRRNFDIFSLRGHKNKIISNDHVCVVKTAFRFDDRCLRVLLIPVTDSTSTRDIQIKSCVQLSSFSFDAPASPSRWLLLPPKLEEGTKYKTRRKHRTNKSRIHSIRLSAIIDARFNAFNPRIVHWRDHKSP